MFDNIPASQATKLAIVFAFCFTIGLLFMSSCNFNSSTESEEELLLVKEPARRMMTGGLGAVREKDDEVVKVVEEIKPQLESKTGVKYASLEVLNYKTQVVAGTNFFVKAEAKTEDGKESIVHLRIYRDLQRKLELTAYQLDKAKDEELKHFEP